MDGQQRQLAASMQARLSLWLSLPDGADDRVAAAKDALLGQVGL